MIAEIIEMMAKILFVFGINMGFFSPMLGWVERKQSAAIQDRVGANRADIFGLTIFGLFHSLADVIKLVTKEDFRPKGSDPVIHTLAPVVSLVPALIAFAIIPFGGTHYIYGHEVNLIIADLDMGLLYLFAFASLAAYGPVLAGWASNSNWSFLGGLRATAQMLSYEVAMGLSIIGVIMVYGSVSLSDIGAAQDNFLRWGIFMQPLGFLLFFTCATAENKRIPFDMPEGESEIVAGYFTEYSGMKFIMFWMGEFLEMVTIAALITALFLGAWHLPFVSDSALLEFFAFAGPDGANILAMLVAVGTFFGKVCFMLWLQMALRWSLPRFRYDQLMNLGWKIILPLSLVNIALTGLLILMRN